MRVHINETRRHQTPVSFERALCRANIGADRNNRVAVNRYVGSSRFGTQTVDDQSPTDHHIMHVLTVPLSQRP
jgi:hypothetical protein